MFGEIEDRKLASIICVILLFTMLISGCTSDKNNQDVKEDALEFSLKIIETYLTGNSDKYLSYHTNVVYLLGQNRSLNREELNQTVNSQTFPHGEDYSDYTMDDYLETYDQEIMDYKEYISEYPSIKNVSIDGWSPNEDDYIFFGYEVKPEKEGFMWDDLLTFMVSNQGGSWEVIGYLN